MGESGALAPKGGKASEGGALKYDVSGKKGSLKGYGYASESSISKNIQPEIYS